MFDPNFQKTLTERTGDIYRTVAYNKSDAQKARAEALCEKVQKDYFDSGLHDKEIDKAQGGGING